jgi:hypothetical protein
VVTKIGNEQSRIKSDWKSRQNYIMGFVDFHLKLRTEGRNLKGTLSGRTPLIDLPK